MKTTQNKQNKKNNKQIIFVNIIFLFKRRKDKHKNNRKHNINQNN